MPHAQPPIVTAEQAVALYGYDAAARRGHLPQRLVEAAMRRMNAAVHEDPTTPEIHSDGCGEKRGTPGGARKHRRLGEEVCFACVQAERAQGRWYRQQEKARRTA
jgi:hypothetical protein